MPENTEEGNINSHDSQLDVIPLENPEFASAQGPTHSENPTHSWPLNNEVLPEDEAENNVDIQPDEIIPLENPKKLNSRSMS